MTKKPFKILSIDGGGIKGLYSATILKNFEEEFKTSIGDHFDLICGTSTGGLIALAISQGIPCSRICDFYKQQGPIIFPNRPLLLRWFQWLEEKLGGKYFPGQTWWFGKYSSAPLRKALEEFFGTAKLGDSKNLLCIPTYDITDARPWVFKYDHTDRSRDNGATYVDVALATAAAPTYFPIHEIPHYQHKQFIDGGVWANNPSLTGVIEALKFFVGEGSEYDSIEILSVSSLSITQGQPTGWRRKRSFIGWRSDLFDVFTDGQSQFTHYTLKTLSELKSIPILYERIPSESISRNQAHLVQLDNASKNALNLISGKGEDVGTVQRKRDEIKKFFTSTKTYKTINHGK